MTIDCETHDMAVIEAARLKRRVEQLEGALRELAVACQEEFGDGMADDEPDESSVFAGIPDGEGITFGMIRRALAVL